MNTKETITIHDNDLGDIKITKHENGSIVFRFPKAQGWMYAKPATVQHPEHAVIFGFNYADAGTD